MTTDQRDRATDESTFDEVAWQAEADENQRLSEAQTLEQANINIMVPEEPVPPPMEIPTGGEAEEFLQREADWDQVSLAEKRKEVEAIGFGNYVLAGLKQGRLRFTEAWNALEVNFFELLQLAYSNEAIDLPASIKSLLDGRPNPLAEKIRNDPDLVIREISFTPSFNPEEATPQFAEIAYDAGVRNAPVVICQHGGYPGSRMMELPTIQRLAAQGIFAIAVSKRGRDGSAGRPDAWCKETADIVDALDFCEKEYSDFLDPTNVTVRGGSGGGLDSISLLVRYPDRFRFVIPFFGYAELTPMIEQVFGPHVDEAIKASARTAGSVYAVRRFGYDSGYGRPDYEDRRLARTLSMAAENNPYARVHFAWDEDDPLSPKMDEWFETFRAASVRMGSNNVQLHRSKRGDLLRYPHWLASDNDAFDRFYIPAILSGTVPEPRLALTGFLVVPGFLKTRRFEIILGEGDNAAARVDYRVGIDGGEFRFRRLSQKKSVPGRLRFHNQRLRSLGVRVNGETVVRSSKDEWIECSFGLDDTVVISGRFEMSAGLVKEAEAAFAEARFDVAQRLYEEIVAADPDDSQAVLRLGRLQLYSNQLHEARQSLTRAAKLMPEEKQISGLLAEAAYRQDDYATSAEHQRAAGQDGPADKLESFAGQTPYETIGPDPAEIKWLVTDPLPLLEVRVNGSDPIVMFIDTGGWEIILDRDLAAELSLPIFGTFSGRFAAGKTGEVQHSRLEEVAIGPLTIRNVPISTLPTRRFAQVWGDRYQIDGVIGTAFLYHFLSTMDYPGGKLILERRIPENAAKAKGDITVPFWMAGSHLMLAWGRVNGSPQLMFVDTGLAGGGWTGPPSTIELANVTTFPERATETEMGGGQGAYTTTPLLVDELSLGDAVETNIPGSAGLFPSEHSNDFRIGGVISHAFFKPYRFTLDFDQMQYFLTRTGESTPPRDS